MNDLFLILFLVAGVFLIAIEIMLVPGFTYFGLSGIISLVIAIILAFLNYSTSVALGIMSVSIFVVIAFFIWFFKKGINRGFALKGSEKAEDGYLSYQENYQQFINKSGIAHSPLRPAGIVIIDGTKLSAVSQGDYIDAGEAILVLKVEGTKLIVRKKR
jgi:membrane-bound serine protease (ClpP class)